MPPPAAVVLEAPERSVWSVCFEGTDSLFIRRIENAGRWPEEVDGIWSSRAARSLVVEVTALGGPGSRDVWPVGGEGVTVQALPKGSSGG